MIEAGFLKVYLRDRTYQEEFYSLITCMNCREAKVWIQKSESLFECKLCSCNLQVDKAMNVKHSLAEETAGL